MIYETTLRLMRTRAPHSRAAYPFLYAPTKYPVFGGTTSLSTFANQLRNRTTESRPRGDKAQLPEHVDGAGSDRGRATSEDNTHVYNPALNPPASTRPPPLELPSRDPQASTVSHYLAVGKAYLRFYKAGIKAVFTNRRLLRETLASKPDPADRKPPSPFGASVSVVPASYSRADWLLLWRVRHDLVRVPLFALVLLICGEFTPLVVIAIDGVVPYTCRLPRQISASMRRAEERRAESFAYLERRYGNTTATSTTGTVPRRALRDHVLRSLHLSGAIWDKLGVIPPGMWGVKGSLRMAFLEGDDKLLMQDGGLSGLEAEEVKIACVERGVDVVGKGDGEMRRLLGDWLRLTASEDAIERRKRMTVLLTTRMENWPVARDFELPDWHL